MFSIVVFVMRNKSSSLDMGIPFWWADDLFHCTGYPFTQLWVTSSQEPYTHWSTSRKAWNQYGCQEKERVWRFWLMFCI